jgi:hypothetical protein
LRLGIGKEMRRHVAETVVQTSSSGARLFGKLVIDDLDHDADFTPQRAYGTAKLENILFTSELHRRYHDRASPLPRSTPVPWRQVSPPTPTAS